MNINGTKSEIGIMVLTWAGLTLGVVCAFMSPVNSTSRQFTSNPPKNGWPPQALRTVPQLTVRAINLPNTPKIRPAFRAGGWPGTTDSAIGEEFYIQQHKLRITLVRLLSYIQLERVWLIEKSGATHDCRCLDSLFTWSDFHFLNPVVPRG